MAQEEEDVRDYSLMEEQKAIKDGYPPVNRSMHVWITRLLSSYMHDDLLWRKHLNSVPWPQLHDRYRDCGPLQTVEVETQGRWVADSNLSLSGRLALQFSADEYVIPGKWKYLILIKKSSSYSQLGWEKTFLSKHPQGTEVKVITYSAMQVHKEEKPEVFLWSTTFKIPK